MRARHSASSASRLPTPASADWSSSRAFTAARLPPTRLRNASRVTVAASGPSRPRAPSSSARPSRRLSRSATRVPSSNSSANRSQPRGASRLVHAERPAHAQVQREVDARVGLEPQVLAAAVRGRHGGAAQHGVDLALPVRPADERVVVVDPRDRAADRGALQHLARALGLGQLGHAGTVPATRSCAHHRPVALARDRAGQLQLDQRRRERRRRQPDALRQHLRRRRAGGGSRPAARAAVGADGRVVGAGCPAGSSPSATSTSSTDVTGAAPSRSRPFCPAWPPCHGVPGTASTSRPSSRAAAAVIRAPLRAAASTTTTASRQRGDDAVAGREAPRRRRHPGLVLADDRAASRRRGAASPALARG